MCWPSRSRQDRKQSIYQISIERQTISIHIFTNTYRLLPWLPCHGKEIKIFILCRTVKEKDIYQYIAGQWKKIYLSIYCRALRNQAAVCWRLRSRSSWGRRWSWWWWWWSSWCWWWWWSGCWGHDHWYVYEQHGKSLDIPVVVDELIVNMVFARWTTMTLATKMEIMMMSCALRSWSWCLWPT